jgi:hypothetical protein
MEELARQTLDNLPGTESSHLLSLLPETGRIPDSERIFRGPYSLEPIYIFGERDVLNLRGRIFGVSADYTGQEKKMFTFKDYRDRFGSVLVEKNILDTRVNLENPPKI